MDEPCSALDPRSTTRIEDLIGELRGEYTIIIVTHNMQQAARVSDYTAFLYEGALVEFGPTKQFFTKPEKKETEDYITGRFGIGCTVPFPALCRSRLPGENLASTSLVDRYSVLARQAGPTARKSGRTRSLR